MRVTRHSVDHDMEQDGGSLSGFSVLILSRASNPGRWVQVPKMVPLLLSQVVWPAAGMQASDSGDLTESSFCSAYS